MYKTTVVDPSHISSQDLSYIMKLYLMNDDDDVLKLKVTLVYVIIDCNYKIKSNCHRLIKQFRVVSIIPPKNT